MYTAAVQNVALAMQWGDYATNTLRWIFIDSAEQ